MKFKSVCIQNFLTIGEATVALSDRGLVLIQGENRDDTSADSNGAGKSSVADAVCWALYGVTARGESGDSVVNRVAGKDCVVEVTIEDDADTYIVARHRKHKAGKNALLLKHIQPAPGTVVDLTKGTDKLTQIEVDKLLGCSYEVFRSSVYAGQNSMPDLPGMTDKQLKLLVEEAAGTTVLDAAYGKARDAMSVAKAGVAHQTAALTANKAQIDSHMTRVAELVNARREWGDGQRVKMDGLIVSAKAYAEKAKGIAGELAAYDKAIIESSIKECDDAINAVAGEQVKERTLAAKITNAASEVARTRALLESLGARHKKAKAEIDAADHKLGCPCDECGRPLTAAELAPAKDAARKRANAIAAEFNDTRKQLEASIAAHKTLADELEAFRASMTDVSKTSAQRASLLTKQRDVQSLERERDAAIAEAKALVARSNELAKENNPYDGLVKSAKAKLAEEIDKTTGLEVAVREAEKALQIAESAVKVFSPTGVRGQVLDEVTPYLNDQTAKYLSTLSDGNIRATWTTIVKTKKGDLKEQFAIEVENDKGGGSFGLISGGEQRKVQISCALALQDLVATRATKQIDLFIGDEIDNALDPAGLERLVQVLEEKARERGSVFVISHSDLKDWIGNILTVVKEGGKSHIVEVVE